MTPVLNFIPARRSWRATHVAASCALVALAALSTVAGAQEAAPQPAVGSLPLDRIAAVVGSTAILVSDIEAAIVGQRIEVPADSAERAQVRRDVLQQLIDMEVIVQKATADTSILIDEGELQSMADVQVANARKNFPTDEAFRAALVEAGFGSPDEYRDRQIEELRRRQLQELYMASLQRSGRYVTVNVSEREVNEELAKYEGRFPERPASIGFQQIVLPTLPGDASREKARKLIDSLYLALRDKPTAFEEAAREFSEDPSAENGGDLGWNRRGVMVPEFDRVMFMINPGVVSPPVESRYGWHLIRVDRVQPAEVKARHILIRAATDSTDDARAQQLADTVRAMWERGISFDSLRVRYHDEKNGEDAIIPEIRTADLPEAYGSAIGSSERGAIVGPFPVDDPGSGGRKWIVLKLTRVQPAGQMSVDEARRDLRKNMQQLYSYRRLLDSLRKDTYVSVRM